MVVAVGIGNNSEMVVNVGLNVYEKLSQHFNYN